MVSVENLKPVTQVWGVFHDITQPDILNTLYMQVSLAPDNSVTGDIQKGKVLLW
jgi:hypothetical protein